MKPDRHSAFDLEKQTISNNLEFLLSSRIRFMNNLTSLTSYKTGHILHIYWNCWAVKGWMVKIFHVIL